MKRVNLELISDAAVLVMVMVLLIELALIVFIVFHGMPL